MKRTTAVVLTVAACGRLGFAPRIGDGGAASHCGIGTTAPDPLTISGTTFEYTTFTSVTSAPNIAVHALLAGTPVSMTTSDGSGAYTLAVPTAGHAVPLVLVYGPSGYFTTTIYSDGAYDRDTTGVAPPYRFPADAPVWGAGAMGSIYSDVGQVRDPSRGSLSIAVRDCARNPVFGVAVTITPPPGVMTYVGSNGQSDTAATETVAPFGAVFAANAQAGPTHITLSGGGLTFPAVDIDVGSGSANTLVEVRGDAL